jgi:hypothetical protein
MNSMGWNFVPLREGHPLVGGKRFERFLTNLPSLHHPPFRLRHEAKASGRSA